MGPIITPHKRKKSNNIEKLKEGDKTTTCNKTIANIFNKFFSNIGAELSDKFPNETNFEHYLTREDQCMFLSPITRTELLKHLQKLDPHKTCGPDNLKPKILRESAEYTNHSPTFSTYHLKRELSRTC
jgi:hypothetical protein